MGKSIENFLGLTKKEIDKRKSELKEKIPTLPGTAYLKLKLKEFSVQPWPFIIYLANNFSQEMRDVLTSYRIYDGSENSQVIIEKLKEYYIQSSVLFEIEKEISTK